MKKEETYNRWSNKDKEAIHRLYSYASKEEILEAIPNRGWRAICETACHYGLHRSYVAKGKAISKGLRKRKIKRI
jgi:hypothetical protein